MSQLLFNAFVQRDRAHLFLSPQIWSSCPRSCFLEHRRRPRRILSFNESRHSHRLLRGNNYEVPFHFGRINNPKCRERYSCAHRFSLVIFSRPWVTDTRPINASGDAWQNRAIAFINTNGGSPRARRGVLQWRMRTTVRGVVCSSNGSSSVVAFFSHRSHASRVCVDQTRARKTVRGKKCSRRARQPKRGSNGIRKFNPSVCGFFAIGGRPVEFVGGLTTGFADGTFARSYIVSHTVRLLSSPLPPPLTLCKILVYILVYISFNVNFLRRDVRNLNI